MFIKQKVKTPYQGKTEATKNGTMSYKCISLKIIHSAQQKVKNNQYVVVHLLVTTKIVHDSEINQTLSL